MNCLGATSHVLPFPCIAFSRLLDQGIPAACERDMSSGLCLALSQLLFDKPGFQNNLCPDTSDGCMIASHGTRPLRLAGTEEPLDVLNYPLVHNHHHVTFFGDHRQESLDFYRLRSELSHRRTEFIPFGLRETE